MQLLPLPSRHSAPVTYPRHRVFLGTRDFHSLTVLPACTGIPQYRPSKQVLRHLYHPRSRSHCVRRTKCRDGKRSEKLCCSRNPMLRSSQLCQKLLSLRRQQPFFNKKPGLVRTRSTLGLRPRLFKHLSQPLFRSQMDGRTTTPKKTDSFGATQHTQHVQFHRLDHHRPMFRYSHTAVYKVFLHQWATHHGRSRWTARQHQLPRDCPVPNFPMMLFVAPRILFMLRCPVLILDPSSTAPRRLLCNPLERRWLRTSPRRQDLSVAPLCRRQRRGSMWTTYRTRKR